MEIYGITFIVHGPGTPCEFLFKVDPSNSFSCSVDSGGAITCFYLIGDETSVGDSADSSVNGWSTITVNGFDSVTTEPIGGSNETE